MMRRTFINSIVGIISFPFFRKKCPYRIVKEEFDYVFYDGEEYVGVYNDSKSFGVKVNPSATIDQITQKLTEILSPLGHVHLHVKYEEKLGHYFIWNWIKERSPISEVAWYFPTLQPLHINVEIPHKLTPEQVAWIIYEFRQLI